MPTSPTTALVVKSPVDVLVAAFLSSRTPATLKAYSADLKCFATWSGSLTSGDAAAKLLGAGAGPANAACVAYRTHLSGLGLSPATINRRLAALRSLVKLARSFGQVGWFLEVQGPRGESYRNTLGPGRDGVRLLLAQLGGDGPAHCRDRAILRLLYDLGLRRAEVVGLDVVDVGPEACSVQILGKGRTQKETLTCPAPTATAVQAWLATGIPVNGGPLFVALDRAHRGGRLAGHAVYRIVRELGEAVGIRARPHGIRHSAITRALDLTGGNVREAARFSRHKNVNTLMRYDDRRRDDAGAIAGKLAGDMDQA